MKLLLAALRGVFAITLSLLLTDASKAAPVEIETDAGVISGVVTVEAIDVTTSW